MQWLKVIAPQGATVRGPAGLVLTAEQHRRRVAVLGPAKGKGGRARYTLPAGAETMFKLGEVFGCDQEGRLNGLLFEPCDKDGNPVAEAAAPDPAGGDGGGAG